MTLEADQPFRGHNPFPKGPWRFVIIYESCDTLKKMQIRSLLITIQHKYCPGERKTRNVIVSEGEELARALDTEKRTCYVKIVKRFFVVSRTPGSGHVAGLFHRIASLLQAHRQAIAAALVI